MKTSELTEAALDWAVAKCEGHLEPQPYFGKSIPRVVVCDKTICDEVIVRLNPTPQVYYEPRYSPSTDWAEGGPIIEREKIDLSANPVDGNWLCTTLIDDDTIALELGPTPLIAAMRCYVASKLGEEVEIPEELK